LSSSCPAIDYGSFLSPFFPPQFPVPSRSGPALSFVPPWERPSTPVRLRSGGVTIFVAPGEDNSLVSIGVFCSCQIPPITFPFPKVLCSMTSSRTTSARCSDVPTKRGGSSCLNRMISLRMYSCSFTRVRDHLYPPPFRRPVRYVPPKTMAKGHDKFSKTR